jgi:Protein of unknown function (DUF3179)
VYSRRVEDRTLTFGVSGMLKDNALIIFDEETKTVWSHITGVALAGPLKGRRLKRIAGVPRITWSQVKAEYPEAKVLVTERGRADLPVSHYADYHASDRVGVRPMSAPDDYRLAPKALVAGLEIGGAAKAYPLELLARKRLIQDEVGGTPVVAARVAKAEAVVVYDRRVGDRTLTFEAPTEDGRMKDAETGSLWAALRGVAVEGSLRGKTLTRLPHVTMYWFGWHAYHPKTAVYGER